MDPIQYSKPDLIQHIKMLIYQLEEMNSNDQELEERLEELERFYKAMIDREMRMVELKKYIAGLEKKLDQVSST
ncbi:MAG: hypothetical protein ACE5D8_08440 [Fidelibacterota bacterium]